VRDSVVTPAVVVRWLEDLAVVRWSVRSRPRLVMERNLPVHLCKFGTCHLVALEESMLSASACCYRFTITPTEQFEEYWPKIYSGTRSCVSMLSSQAITRKTAI